jgi:hypothetical protein
MIIQSKEKNDSTIPFNQIDKNKYIISIVNNYLYDRNDLVDNEYIDDLICPICLNILYNPINCSSNNNSHSFCKECIDKYLEEYNSCPMCKNKFEYKTSEEVIKKLNRLYFKCIFREEGCQRILNYSEYFKHVNKCEYRIKIYECQIEKYNYLNRSFEKCGYVGKNNEIEEHFKKCAYTEYFCNFCKEKIFQINLRRHVEDVCRVGIMTNEDGDKYIGERKETIKEGIGVCYYSNGDKYQGEFKNDKKNGYGIYFYDSNGFKYEGEWKDDIKDGYGQFYFSNGTIYEGEFKNDKMDGCGILFFTKGDKYE